MPPRKKIVIPKFQKAAADTDAMWAVLDSAIQQIFAKEQSKLSYEVLYRNAYNMVLHKQGETLYSNVRRAVANHLNKRASQIARCNAGEFMGELQQQWKDFKLAITMVRDVCMYLDRTWVEQQVAAAPGGAALPPVYEMGLDLFQRIVARDKQIKQRLLDTMLDYVEREREGQTIPRSTAKTISGMWHDISPRLYREDFELPMLEATRLYYARLAQSLVGRPGVGAGAGAGGGRKRSCAAFFAEVERRLADESARTDHYLHDSTGPKIRAVVESTMLTPHAVAELSDHATGLKQQLLQDRLVDLRREFSLLRHVTVQKTAASGAGGSGGGGEETGEGLKVLSGMVGECLSEYTRSVVTDAETSKEPVAFVASLLDMQSKFDTLLRDAFGRDKVLQEVMRRCLADGLNLQDSVAKLLVDYVDALLRKGGLPEPPEESQVEGRLDDLITLYVHLKDKDVFNHYYKRAVSGRMLGEKSISDYLEQAFVSKVKLNCGASHVRDVETMLQDVKLSDDLVVQYGQTHHPQGEDQPALSFRILNERVWPSYRIGEPLLLPPELAVCLDQLTSFYDGVRAASSGGSGGSHTVVRWVVEKCKAEIVPNYGRFTRVKTRPLRMEVDAYQAAILLLFNRPGVNAEVGLTLVEIASMLNLDLETARRYAMSLSLNKYKALRKSDEKAKKTVGDAETLRPNEKLAMAIIDKKTKRPRPRVSFPVPKSKSLKTEEDDVVNMAVQEERKYAIEAAVVRSMKMNRTMKASELVLSVVQQLAYLFKAEPK